MLWPGSLHTQLCWQGGLDCWHSARASGAGALPAGGRPASGNRRAGLDLPRGSLYCILIYGAPTWGGLEPPFPPESFQVRMTVNKQMRHLDHWTTRCWRSCLVAKYAFLCWSASTWWSNGQDALIYRVTHLSSQCAVPSAGMARRNQREMGVQLPPRWQLCPPPNCLAAAVNVVVRENPWHEADAVCVVVARWLTGQAGPAGPCWPGVKAMARA